MSRVRPRRETLKISPAQAAPVQIIVYTLPLWGASLLLMFAMPITGIVSSLVIAGCVFVLPFKAKKGECPGCGRKRLFPFSGFGSACKGCGEDIVLRENEIHLLEPRSRAAVDGSGRGFRPTRKD